MDAVLSVSGLKKRYEVRRNPFSLKKETINAVDGVSFGLERGETLGLVGESGCGKSTVARCITLLETPDAGNILFLGSDWVGLAEEQRKRLRKEMQIIFQDPYSSLNPRKKIFDIVAEPIVTHRMCARSELPDRVGEVMRNVGLDEDFLKKYPHEMSGGQRQRVAIGRALATSPSLVIADEPVSSLDVSVQAQIINLFLDIKERLTLSMLFISHDLNIVRFVSDAILVMYRGRIVEMGRKEELFGGPLHPYTKLLMEASTGKGIDRGSDGESENLCVFFERCLQKETKCSQGMPQLQGAWTHKVACFLANT
jgi:oligopeptide/dipeptide ABC transporter ATP-binding protein